MNLPEAADDEHTDFTISYKRLEEVPFKCLFLTGCQFHHDHQHFILRNISLTITLKSQLEVEMKLLAFKIIGHLYGEENNSIEKIFLNASRKIFIDIDLFTRGV